MTHIIPVGRRTADGGHGPGTVRALSDAALRQLADALYRHLDTSSPSFGTRTWYDFAAQSSRAATGGGECGRADGEPAEGPALARRIDRQG